MLYLGARHLFEMRNDPCLHVGIDKIVESNYLMQSSAYMAHKIDKCEFYTQFDCLGSNVVMHFFAFLP